MLIDDFAAEGVTMYYYRCRYCYMYHLTKNMPGTRVKTKVKAKYRRHR